MFQLFPANSNRVACLTRNCILRNCHNSLPRRSLFPLYRGVTGPSSYGAVYRLRNNDKHYTEFVLDATAGFCLSYHIEHSKLLFDTSYYIYNILTIVGNLFPITK